jgi:hypothetical protein
VRLLLGFHFLLDLAFPKFQLGLREFLLQVVPSLMKDLIHSLPQVPQGPDDPKSAAEVYRHLPLAQQLLPRVVSIQPGTIGGTGVVHVKVFELAPTCERKRRTRREPRIPVNN